MNAGTANVIPVKLFPLDPFFNVFNRWQLPLQFFRQAVTLYALTPMGLDITVRFPFGLFFAPIIELRRDNPAQPR